MFHRVLTLAAIVLAIASLPACGVVAAFVPDQKVQNALGIAGVSMKGTVETTKPEPIDFPPGESASLQSDFGPMAASTRHAQMMIVRELKNSDQTIPIDPRELVQPIGFSKVIVTKPTDDGIAFPETMSASAYMNITLWDGFVVQINSADEFINNYNDLANSYSSSSHKLVKGDSGTITLVKDSSDCTTRKCTYTLSPETPAVTTLTLSKSDLQTLEAILKPGSNSNSVYVWAYFALTSDPGLVDGAEIRAVLADLEGTIKF